MKETRKPKKGSKNSSPEKTSEWVGKPLLSGSEDAPGLTKLRQKAEAHLSLHPERLENLSKQDMKQIIHELGTYQIELEMQNEELLKTQQTLEESRRRLADLYDFAPVGYFSLDPDGMIVGVNLIGASMLGEAKNKLIRKSLSLFVDQEDVDIFYFFLQAIMREESRQVTECRLKKKNGTLFHVQLEGLPVWDDEGTIVEIRTSISDISQRIVAETSLRQKTSLLRTIIDSTDVMLVYLDRDFNFVWVNQGYAAISGMTPEEMAGKNHFDLFPDPENENIFCRVRDTGEPVFYKDKEFQFPDQPERGVTYWDWSLNPVMEADGRVIGLVLSLRETTQYKKMQLALAESEERFRLMAETSIDIIFQMQTDGIVTYISPAVSRLGYTPEQVVGRSFSDFISALDLPLARDAFQQVSGGEEIRLMEFKVLKADGSSIACEISATPVKKGGAVTGVQGIARDITARKEVEDKIRLQNNLLSGINYIFEAGMNCESDEELALESLRIAEQLTGSKFGFIGEIGPDGLLHELADSDPGWDKCTGYEKTGHRKAPGNSRLTGFCTHVLTERAPFFTNDPSDHPTWIDAPDGHPPLTALLGVPLVYGEKTIGLIAVVNRDGGYRDADLTTIRTLVSAFVEILFKCRMEKALQESEALAHTRALQLQQLLDFTPIPVWIAHDPECRKITGNLAAAELFGTEADQNVSQSPLSGEQTLNLRICRNGRELDEKEMPLHYAVANDIRVDDVEIEIVLSDGQEIVLLGCATPLYDTQGKVQGGIGAYLDITERKWMEKQLQQAKLEWERTFDAVPDLISILDSEHRIMRVNRAMAKTYGLSPTQSIGHHCFTCVHGTSHSVENCPHSLTMKDGREHAAQVHEDRLGMDFLVTTTPFFNKQGEVTATVHVARDITELKKTERLLLESEKRLKRAQRMAHLGSWELDTLTNVMTWSDEMFRIFGVEPQSFAPSYEDFLVFVHPDDRQKLGKTNTDSHREGESGYELEHRIIQSCTGAVRSVYAKCYHYRDNTGNVIRSVGMVQDISERKAAEVKILALNKSLQHSIGDLDSANRELERSNQDLQQYASIISHDLQEPLRTVSSFIQLLHRRYQNELDDKAGTFINFALEGTVQMERLLQDLLKFSRVGGGELRLETVALDAVLDKTLKTLQSLIKESGAQIQSDSLSVVIADEMQLIHLLQNLISNAIKFRGDDPPRIRIWSELADSEWIICVQDNGIGIDPQYFERIFLIFQRLHRREEYEGTGIGLAICKKIVERHGGRIWYDSKPGQGATFCFSLPAE